MSAPLPPSLVHEARARLLSRRWFFGGCGVGLAGIAAGSLMAAEQPAATKNPLGPRPPHFAPRAKRVVYLFQAGAPSQIELFDSKPELAKRDGTLPPKELLEGYRAAFINPNSALLGPKYKFRPYGRAGVEMSELLPGIGGIADDICLIRSMQTDAVNHAPAQILMNTGSQQFGRPSFGAWTLYGLGCETSDLPGFVVLTSAKGTSGGASNYGAGFLPTMYGGVPLRAGGDPLLYLSNPRGIDRETQRSSLDSLNRLNSLALDSLGDPEIAARVQAYEMAYRLQESAPDLLDLASEPTHVLERYGIDDPAKGSFARNCLIARRLLERGVRFVQLFHEAWDHHSNLAGGVKGSCASTDRASAALVTDLKDRGLLDDTIVVWGGEFGRTPMMQGGTDGRDHHNRAFSMWLAGGGIKAGHVHGATDDFGFNVIKDPVHVHDLNATLLHLLGFDHTKLTYRVQGRDYRLTDVHGNLVKGIIA